MADAFEFVTEVPVRYRDLDPFDHVNNAVYATYCEQARVDYRDRVLAEAFEEAAFVVASLELSYRRSVTLSDSPVAVAVRVPELGRTSFPMRYELRTGDGVAATAETVQVAVDGDGDSRPLPASWRDRVRAFEGLDDDASDAAGS
jgi:acyl-CoA thioester hydrolase